MSTERQSRLKTDLLPLPCPFNLTMAEEDEDKTARAVAKAIEPLMAQIAMLVASVAKLTDQMAGSCARIEALEKDRATPTPSVAYPDPDILEAMENKMADLEDRSRRQNLVFRGLKQVPPNQLEQEIVKFADMELGIKFKTDDLVRTHYLGRTNLVITKFHSWKLQQAVLFESRQRRPSVQVWEDFSDRTRTARSKMFPLLKKLRDEAEATKKLKPRQAVAKIFYDGATFQFHHSRNAIEKQKDGITTYISVDGGFREFPKEAPLLPSPPSQVNRLAPAMDPVPSGSGQGLSQPMAVGTELVSLSPKSVMDRLDQLSQEFSSLRREVSVEKETAMAGGDGVAEGAAPPDADKAAAKATVQDKRKRRCSSSPKLLLPKASSRGFGSWRGAKRPRGGSKGTIRRYFDNKERKEKAESDGFETAASDQESETLVANVE